MKKFSSVRSRRNKNIKKGESVWNNEHMEIINYENWTVLKENDSIACIPYFIESNEFILRYEYIPSYKYSSGNEYHITILSGTIEDGEKIEDCLLRELEEEAGLVMDPNYKIENRLSPIFFNKSGTKKVYPFILPISEKDYQEILPKGDGSEAESKSKCVKISAKYIDGVQCSDLITSYMLLKLKEYLNLKL